jgi:hypothetical protein
MLRRGGVVRDRYNENGHVETGGAGADEATYYAGAAGGADGGGD